MYKLTIITINYNNSSGLYKTIRSVLNQTTNDFEYIIVDGASSDDSLQIIQQLDQLNNRKITYISEPDLGIYNAMNKGIRMAKGEYVQFLNSGDILAANDVTERMLNVIDSQGSQDNSYDNIDILYGNMLKQMPKRLLRDKGFAGRMPTMLDFYTGTLNHSPAYIRRNLFERYGLYDEGLKIVSDWKWYLQVIGLNRIVPIYVDIDVTVFDMNGISTINSDLDQFERHFVLENLLPSFVLSDYDHYSSFIDQMKRIHRYLLFRRCFWLIDRILFRWEKITNSSL